AEKRGDETNVIALARNVESRHARRAAVRANRGRQNAQQRRLSRSVAPNDLEHRSALDRKRNTSERPAPAITSRKVFDFNRPHQRQLTMMRAMQRALASALLLTIACTTAPPTKPLPTPVR